MVAPAWMKSKKDSSSDTAPPGGLRFRSDPSLPPGQRAVVGADGKRVAVVKRIGDKWCGSWDNYSQKFDSPQAALKQFGLSNSTGKN